MNTKEKERIRKLPQAKRISRTVTLYVPTLQDIQKMPLTEFIQWLELNNLTK